MLKCPCCGHTSCEYFPKWGEYICHSCGFHFETDLLKREPWKPWEDRIKEPAVQAAVEAYVGEGALEALKRVRENLRQEILSKST